MGPTKTEAEWREMVAAMRQSGQSCTRWCKEHDINPKTMGNWTRKFRQQESAADQLSFVELGATANQNMRTHQRTAKTGGPDQIQVRCAVCTITFPDAMDVSAVRGVLDTMMSS